MPNPFGQPEKPVAAPERRRRLIQIGILATLVLATCLLGGVIIHVYRSQQSPESAKSEDTTGLRNETTPNALQAKDPPPDINPPMSNVLGVPDDVTSTSPAALAPSPIAKAPAVHSRLMPTHRTVPHSHFRTVSVKSGDTLWRIARKHHTTVGTLKTVNHLKTDRIKVGQKLRIPINRIWLRNTQSNG